MLGVHKPLDRGGGVVAVGALVAYFMHLRFDSEFFTYLFVGGLVLTLGVYAVMGASMVFWRDPVGRDVSPSR